MVRASSTVRITQRTVEGRGAWMVGGRRWRHHRLARLALACLVSVLALMTTASPALADSASLTVTNTAGQSDPATGVPRVFTVSGIASVPEQVFVKYRAPGGAPCAPSAESDSGSRFYLFFYGNEVNSSFHLQEVVNWSSPGPEMFCIWLSERDNSISTPITQVITFRAPNATISATVSPLTPTPGELTTVTVSGASEVPGSVYAKIRPAGRAGCAPTYEADSGASLIGGQSINGSFSVQATTTQATARTYLICLWLAESERATPAIAGPQSETFTVAPPPPPRPPPSCIVPGFSGSMRLGSVERRLRAGLCRVGHIRYTHSSRVKRGAVVSLTPRPRTRLPFEASVAILVSAGPQFRH